MTIGPTGYIDPSQRANDAKALAALRQSVMSGREAASAPLLLPPKPARASSLFAPSVAKSEAALAADIGLQKARRTLGDLRETLRDAQKRLAEKGPVDFEAQHLTRDRYVSRDTFAEREVFQQRDVYETRDVHETRDVYETRNIYETRDVYETRNIYETQPVYEQQAVYATEITGTRALTGFNRFSDAGLGTGSDFRVQVGSAPVATVKFAGNTRLTVTVGSTTQEFQFANNGGHWRGALLSALNSIDGLTATLNAAGALQLETDAAQSLTLSEVPNAFLDVSPTALDKLGLTAGVHEASVVGYEDVQVGTEEVVVGTEQVVIGTEQVVVGTEQVLIGTEQVVTGTEQVLAGHEQVLVGTETERTGSERVRDGIESVLIGFARTYSPPRLDDVRERIATLAATLKDIGSASRTADDTSSAGVRSRQGAPENLAAVLQGLDPGSIADVESPAAIRQALDRIDIALGKANALEIGLRMPKAGAAASAPWPGDLAILGEAKTPNVSPAGWLARQQESLRRAAQATGASAAVRKLSVWA